MEVYPDIEVYLPGAPISELNQWLAKTLDADPLAEASRGRWRTDGNADGHRFPILLIEKVADGYSSLWFDSPHTPWNTDQEAARSLAQALRLDVRCSLGGWHPGDDPDAFWQVSPDGEEREVHWPDGGQ